MLAVVRFGDGQEAASLDHVYAIASEHAARLSVIGVWRPNWWLWLISAAPGSAVAGIALSAACEHAQQIWRGAARRPQLESLKVFGCGPVSPVVERELAGGRYGYVVGRCADLPHRRVTRWRRRDPSLAVVRF